ncbi:MAG TPA: LysM peptidoglycan-binding domain-containing protein [Anaerolineae bacterium]|nr:LysM peptidoglycan-binding domain-containing protein [Anaerolineae bacterium]
MSDDKNETVDYRDFARCPRCDSLVIQTARLCPLCGVSLPSGWADGVEVDEVAEAGGVEDEGQEVVVEVGEDGEGEEVVVTAVMHERRIQPVVWLIFVAFLVTAFVGSAIVQNSDPVQVALFPTLTPIPPTLTYTPTWTPRPSETPLPTLTPSATPLPLPTNTPQPPRYATVAPGENLIIWALRYGITVDSIIELNGLPENGLVQSGQQLQIPWPTATPPLQPVLVDINGQTLIADPRGCEMYEIQEGDALFAIAVRNDMPLEALLTANRRNEQDVIKPGDVLCIPDIIYDDVLPPTVGPTPTPSATPLPAGPDLLYPPNGANLADSLAPVVLQWVALRDLAPDEQYMVELVAVDLPGSRPRRGFTRDTAWSVPESWRPSVAQVERMRWRVGVVTITGQRDDGAFTYAYGGGFSSPRYFDWLGVVPTPTPVPTLTPTPTTPAVQP